MMHLVHTVLSCKLFTILFSAYAVQVDGGLGLENTNQEAKIVLQKILNDMFFCSLLSNKLHSDQGTI